MEKDSESAQDQRKQDVPDEKKCGPKISHMVITQPSTDLNKYLVDNFHPPTTTSKPALFESSDLSLYQPSARCGAFCISESRLLRWIRVFTNRYYDHLNGGATGYKTTWKEQEAYSSPSKCEKIVIDLLDISTDPDEQVVTITVFVSTGRILIQGKRYKEWCTEEFPVLVEIVNNIQSEPSSEEKPLFTSPLSSFFRKLIIFVSDDEIHTSGNSTTSTTNPDPPEKSAETSNSMDKATLSAEPLSVSASRLTTISALRDTVGTLEAEFTQFQIVSSVTSSN